MSSTRDWETLTPYTYFNQVKYRKLSISKFHALIVSMSANQYINLIVALVIRKQHGHTVTDNAWDNVHSVYTKRTLPSSLTVCNRDLASAASAADSA